MKRTVLELRGLAPPEPMMRIIAALGEGELEPGLCVLLIRRNA